MITKGIITAIDFKGNTCTVRMPLFENVSNDQITGTAIISNTPGSYNGYKVNDVVLVGFEDGQMDKPVILGKLYLGVEAEKADPRGVINVENSTTAKAAILPADTKLANQVDKNMANTAAPYGSLSSLATNLNTLNRDVDQLSVFTHNQFKNIIKEIDSSGSDLITKIEQNARKIELEAQRREDEDHVLSGRITVNANNISAKVEKTQAATSSTGFGWDLDNSHWVLNTYKDGEAVPIFKANSGGVEITNELKIVGYPSITYTRYCQVPIYKSDISNPDPEELNDWNQKIIIEYDEDDPDIITKFDPVPPVYRVSETGEPVEDYIVTGWENCKPNQILIEGIDEIPGSYPRTTMPAFYDADADDPLDIGPYWVWQIDYAQTWQYQSWDWALVDETDGAGSNNTFDTREKYNGDENHTYYIKNTYTYEEITSTTSGIIPGTTKAWKKQALADGTVIKAIMNVDAYPIDYGDDPRIKNKTIRVGGGRAGLIRVVDAEITKLARQARDMAYSATVLAKGKSTNYYSDDDPATIWKDPSDHSKGYKYVIKDGDCWFKTTGTNTELDGNPAKGELKQWVGAPSNESPHGAWRDIGGELVANKITANYINALDITAKKIDIISGSKHLFTADSTVANPYVKIANFNVSGNELTAGADNSAIGMSSDTASKAFWAGNETPASAPFNVSHDGSLYSIKGTIGGFEVDHNSISTVDKNPGDDGSIMLFSGTNDTSTAIGSSGAKTDWSILAGNKFGVDSNGNVFATNLTASGNIQANSIFITDANGQTILDAGYSNAHKVQIGGFEATHSSLSYTGNYIYSNIEAGTTTQYVQDIVPYWRVENIMSLKGLWTQQGWDGMIYYALNRNDFSTNNEWVKVYNNGISLGTISSWENAPSTQQRYEDYTPKELSTTGGFYQNSNTIHLYGSWVDDNGTSVSSDVRYKKDIQDISENYSKLFYKLKPRLFKYKENHSDRFHSGFVVQEILESLDELGLSSNDYAAVCAQGDPTDPDSYWSLRYYELIALCVNEIQKLKAEVDDLKEEIVELKK